VVGLTVRTAGAGDLPALNRAIPTGGNDVHAAFLARQATGDASYLVAWQGTRPVGYGVVRWAGRGEVPGPEISNLYVPEPLRGQGIGTALIRYAESLVRERGHQRVAIGVDGANTRAGGLYGRLGYTDTGLLRTISYSYFDRNGVEQTATEHVRTLARELS
jgi:GNAT superfamily N-acetyltransferase